MPRDRTVLISDDAAALQYQAEQACLGNGCEDEAATDFRFEARDTQNLIARGFVSAATTGARVLPGGHGRIPEPRSGCQDAHDACIALACSRGKAFVQTKSRQ